MTRSFIIFLLIFSTTFSFAQSKKPKQTDSSKPFVLGLIDEIQSKELGEKRILNIYLPEGYQSKRNNKVPRNLFIGWFGR